MKDLAKLFAGLVLAIALVACSEEPASEAEVGVPTETADEFVARVNDEYRDWWRELNAAGWLRSTYINEDSAVVNALANERFAAWHAETVRQALQYDGQELSALSPTGTPSFHEPMKFAHFYDGRSHQFGADPSVTDFAIGFRNATQQRNAEAFLALAEMEKITFMGAAWSGSRLVIHGGITWWYWWVGAPPYQEAGITSTNGGATWEIFDIDGYYQTHGMAYGNGRFVSVGQTSAISAEGAIYTTP